MPLISESHFINKRITEIIGDNKRIIGSPTWHIRIIGKFSGTSLSTTKGTQHLAGEIHSASDLDFYIYVVSWIFQVRRLAICCVMFHN